VPEPTAREVVRSFWAAMQANDRGACGGDVVASEVTVTDGAEQVARVVAFSEVEGGLVRRQVGYRPTPYDPLGGREDLTRPIGRVPCLNFGGATPHVGFVRLPFLPARPLVRTERSWR